MKIDVHFDKRAVTGGTDNCGDTGFIRIYENYCFMALIDALGHGQIAYETALQAETYLSTRYDQDLPLILKGLHQCLTGTRGAVAGVCRLDLDFGVLSYAGMGNIGLRIFGPHQRRLVTPDGVIGYRIRTLKQQQVKLYTGDIFLMSSDGVKEHFDPADNPDVFKGTARDICRAVMKKLGKSNDDASCIVLRYGI